MSSDAAGVITRCLQDWRTGEATALDRLTEEVYKELHRLANVMMRGPGMRTIQPTALVHELYFKLPGIQHIDWESRTQFLNVASRMMRNILVDHARMRQAAKRGGDSIPVMVDPPDEDVKLHINTLAVHQALERFSVKYPRQAHVVELRFFGGLTAQETLEVLNANGENVSMRTVERDWEFARAWLQNAIGTE